MPPHERASSINGRFPVPAGVALCLAGAACILFLGGCGEEQEPDKGANQSLVEIGEHSLERAEALETEGKQVASNLAYKRALWAFSYHEQLTGEEPFLLEEAQEGAERTKPRP